VLSPFNLASGRRNQSYTELLEVTGGDGTYTWQVIGGSLPPGLFLDPDTGEISGTPSGNGQYPFTVEVTSGDQQTTQSDHRIQVTGGN
jgi:hypothetical protein